MASFVLGRMRLNIPAEEFGQLRPGPIIGIGSANIICQALAPTGKIYALRLSTINMRLDLGQYDVNKWEVSETGDFSQNFLDESKWAALASVSNFGVPVYEIFYATGQLQLPSGQSLPVKLGMILMEMFDGTLKSLAGSLTDPDKTSLREISLRMFRTGFVSSDMHNKNILYKNTATGRIWRFIDFEQMEPLAYFEDPAVRHGQTLLEYYLGYVMSD